jgi:DNA replication protein DnaC
MDSDQIDLSIMPLERQLGVLSKQLASCDTHGDFAAITTRFTSTPSGCPECARIARERAEREELQCEIAKAAAERLERKLGASMIPTRFREKSFEDYRSVTAQQRKALAICRDYAENFKANFNSGRCLLLLGNVGTGKTHLAAAIANHIMRNTQAAVVYRTVSGILQHVKGSFDRSSTYSEAEAFSSYVDPHLLIIDEVGATKPTEFELATLFTIVNSRYEQELPTLVISNLSAKELPEAMGERCVDRLREGSGTAISFDWGSERGKRVNGSVADAGSTKDRKHD